MFISIVLSSIVFLVMPLRRYQPMPRSRQGSARDLALSFVMISISLNLSTSRIWSIDHSELSIEMRSLNSLASVIMILLHLLVRVLRNDEFGTQLVPFRR